MQRRSFLKILGLAGLTVYMPPILPMAVSRPLKILVLGGTKFIGPHIVNALISNGHEVTLFNRGRSGAGLFPKLEQLKGDRSPEVPGGLDALRGNRTWDAVIDTWPNAPEIVKGTADLLQERAERYVFVSTVSVYRDTSEIGITEESPVWHARPGARHNYPTGKVACEELVRKHYAGRHMIARAHAIVGPGRAMGGLRYWATRINEGREVLAPGNGDDSVQYTDVVDLANWIHAAAIGELLGTFNTLGPANKTTFKKLLESIKRELASDSKLVWANAEFLRQHDITPWTGMPLWVPASQSAGFTQISNKKLLEAGGEFRPLSGSLADVLSWHDEVGKNLPIEDDYYHFLSYERERELLAAWHTANAA